MIERDFWVQASAAGNDCPQQDLIELDHFNRDMAWDMRDAPGPLPYACALETAEREKGVQPPRLRQDIRRVEGP